MFYLIALKFNSEYISPKKGKDRPPLVKKGAPPLEKKVGLPLEKKETTPLEKKVGLPLEKKEAQNELPKKNIFSSSQSGISSKENISSIKEDSSILVKNFNVGSDSLNEIKINEYFYLLEKKTFEEKRKRDPKNKKEINNNLNKKVESKEKRDPEIDKKVESKEKRDPEIDKKLEGEVKFKLNGIELNLEKYKTSKETSSKSLFYFFIERLKKDSFNLSNLITDEIDIIVKTEKSTIKRTFTKDSLGALIGFLCFSLEVIIADKYFDGHYMIIGDDILKLISDNIIIHPFQTPVLKAKVGKKKETDFINEATSIIENSKNSFSFKIPLCSNKFPEKINRFLEKYFPVLNTAEKEIKDALKINKIILFDDGELLAFAKTITNETLDNNFFKEIGLILFFFASLEELFQSLEINKIGKENSKKCFIKIKEGFKDFLELLFLSRIISL